MGFVLLESTGRCDWSMALMASDQMGGSDCLEMEEFESADLGD